MTARSRSGPEMTAGNDDDELLPRGQRKQRTRDALIDAALQLMNEGRSFNSLGLREITRVAGVVPTSFYRHFKDTNELGLVLVEESGLTLRRMLREARRAGAPVKDMIRRSVRVYKAFVLANRLHFLFVAGERSGGSPVIRSAIRNEVDQFINEMTQDVRHLAIFPNLSPEALRRVCELVVNTMLHAATDVLDLPPGDDALAQAQEDNHVQQVRLIFLGASLWREEIERG
ncbi:MAG: HTH-type transcriptional repressor FabR [Gammaproteobacteria bacterium]|nr:HTH-type transcriptional repressor FabR [Gammaproteobacteria bacterium]